MKYRAGGTSKIKYEHGMISGLRGLLKKMENWEEIKSIIPGRIRPVKKSHALRLKVQYEIEDGLKCLVLSGSAVQEVFIVSSDALALWDRIDEEL